MLSFRERLADGAKGEAEQQTRGRGSDGEDQCDAEGVGRTAAQTPTSTSSRNGRIRNIAIASLLARGDFDA
jgi:hypothetical protein